MSPSAAADRDRRAGEYVLGLLEDAEALAFEAEMAGDPAVAALVTHWRGRLEELDRTATTEPVDEMLWHRIEESLEPMPRSAAEPRRAGAMAGWWSSLAFWRGAGLAAAAVAILLAIGLAASLQRVAPPSMVAVLIAESDGRPLAVVEIGGDGASRLVALDAIPVPAGRALQVWTLPSPEVGPVSIGLLDRSRSLRLDTGDLPLPQPDQLFEITLEPAAGSPTGRPTGPIIVKGFAKLAL